MTKKEFEYCCIIFKIYFNGKKYSEVIENGFGDLAECLIDVNWKIKNGQLKNFVDDIILYFRNEKCYINRPVKIGDHSFKNIKDFSNYFKITLKDIV